MFGELAFFMYFQWLRSAAKCGFGALVSGASWLEVERVHL
jgi:hypothetical protein